MRTAKTLIRLGGCPGWSECSLGAQPHCWFCHEAAHLVIIISRSIYTESPLSHLHAITSKTVSNLYLKSVKAQRFITLGFLLNLMFKFFTSFQTNWLSSDTRFPVVLLRSLLLLKVLDKNGAFHAWTIAAQGFQQLEFPSNFRATIFNIMTSIKCFMDFCRF